MQGALQRDRPTARARVPLVLQSGHGGVQLQGMGLQRFIRRLLSVFPRRPERRYDLITEAMTKPFGGGGGRGATRAGGVTSERKKSSQDA